MKISKYFLAAAIAVCFLAPPLLAQTITTVTGTILDPTGVPYGGAAVTVTLAPPAGGASPTVTATGSPVVMPVVPTLSASGTFTANLIANASITPASTTYSFRFCAPPIPPPLGSGVGCFTITGVTIAGASQDISATANASALALLGTTNNTSRAAAPIPAAGTASIGATTLVTAPAIPATGTSYKLSAYVTQTVLGSACAGNTTVVVNLVSQDPNAASAQTTAIGTFTVTTNGTLGIVPLTTGPGSLPLIAKASTVVQFSTTFTAGGSCAPAPTVQVFPVLEVR
jgi:hypothetical protein